MGATQQVKQSFIPFLMLFFSFHTCISQEGLLVLVDMLRAGRPMNFVSIATEARIYLGCQAPTPTQAQIASYSIDIGISFPGDKTAGA